MYSEWISALRFVSRNRLLAGAVAVVLALGIGASTAVFSLLYDVLLRPLPYPNARQLVFVHNEFPQAQVVSQGVSQFDFATLRNQHRLFTSAGIYYYNDLILTGAGAARHIDVVNTSASLFSTLAVRPLVGRAIAESDDRPEAPPVALLSYSFWQNAFGADPTIMGRQVQLNGTSYTLIGVMPRDFNFPSKQTSMWIPVAMKPASFTLEGGRLEKWLHMVARLAPSESFAAANAGLLPVTHRLAREYGRFYPKQQGWRFRVRPVLDETTAGVRPWLYLAFGCVACVLLLACLNAAGVMFVAALNRSGELAVRGALGASPARIARLAVIECAVLTLPGALLGLLGATWMVALENHWGPIETHLSLPAGGFALGISVLSTLLVAVWPALYGSRVALEPALRSTAGRAVTRRAGWRLTLVASQMALAVTLLFTAALLTRTFIDLTRVPTGMEPARLWSGAVTLPAHDYTPPQSWNTNFFVPLQQRLAALPGVVSVSGANAIPFNPSGVWTEVLNLATPAKPDTPPEAQISVALPGYFETMRIPLLRGRTFSAADRPGQPAVAVINAELARRYFPGPDPLTSALNQRIGSGGLGAHATVIGVVGDVENSRLGGPLQPQIYWPALQERTEVLYFVIRLARDFDPTAVVRAAVEQLNPHVALYDVSPMPDRIAESLRLRRFVAAILNLFAAIGLLLSAVGLYVSAAYLVAARRREIGIRLALGAPSRAILRLVAREGVAAVVLGLVGGSAGVVIASRLLMAGLFGATRHVPEAWGFSVALLAFAFVLAMTVPAARAFAVQPAEVLRQE